MSQSIEQVNAYILHSRPFQESSLILQLFTLQQGRISIIAKGIKGKKSQSRKAILQPFQEVELSLSGRSTLKTLTHCEVIQPQVTSAYLFKGKTLACAYYANELLTRTLPESEPFTDVYQIYRGFLSQLLTEKKFPPLLRQFEILLMQSIGVAPDFEYDASGQSIEPKSAYVLSVDDGFCLATETEESKAYLGSAILALAGKSFDESDWNASQQICRILLREIIGDKPLQSRKLWQHMNLNT